MRQGLKQGLAGLPRPKNDYEIVVPEDMEQGLDDHMENGQYVEDQADIDDQTEADRQARRKYSLY